MKRVLAMSLFGLAMAVHNVALSQGALQFNNYQTPYVSITWFGDGSLVGPDDAVRMEVWWGWGEIEDWQLTQLAFGAVAEWSAFDGYTLWSQVFLIPHYGSGQTLTFQLRAYSTGGWVPGEFWWLPDGYWAQDGELLGMGPTVTTSDIGNYARVPPELPTLVYTPGFQIGVLIPEPSMAALLTFGSITLLIWRRRAQEYSR